VSLKDRKATIFFRSPASLALVAILWFDRGPISPRKAPVMHKYEKIAFVASDVPLAQTARAALAARFGHVDEDKAEVVVALGGDGFMLETLNKVRDHGVPVYGMNRGTVGFLMNEYSETDLMERLSEAEEEVINPLLMKAQCVNGETQEALAINEVSLLRSGPQAAKLRISIDGRLRLEELVCDGAMVATPAGSTAYNYSAHGPILPIGSDVLALTAVAAFRPRRWRETPGHGRRQQQLDFQCPLGRGEIRAQCQPPHPV